MTTTVQSVTRHEKRSVQLLQPETTKIWKGAAAQAVKRTHFSLSSMTGHKLTCCRISVATIVLHLRPRSMTSVGESLTSSARHLAVAVIKYHG